MRGLDRSGSLAEIAGASDIQRAYYAQTASEYDAAHLAPLDSGHDYGLVKLLELVEATGAGSVLDVGTGTGRALLELTERQPELAVHGLDPSPEMIEVAASHGVPRDVLTVGSGEQLPFADESFDVVCEFGVLHHTATPALVVAEMMRVAKVGIVISDHNRFGQGSMRARRIKLVLARLGVWQFVYRALHGGKPYNISEGDGLAYSYSVFDDYSAVADWGDRVEINVHRVSASSRHPVFTGAHVVLVASRQQLF